MNVIANLAELEALYGTPGATSLTKETVRLTAEYRRWIAAAPFLAIATSGPGGLDCSPRGDATGQLLHVLDDATIAIPDRRGNNRLDTLRNLVGDPRVALLFLAPGINETLRINGRAVISTDPALIGRFGVGGKMPATVIVVTIGQVYFQCARALVRSRLWDTAAHVDPALVPTPGEMVRSADTAFDADAYDAALPARQAATLY